ncbi:MAG: methyltransferase [Armatimonadetes bacterium]|nr:methyltransferase [Armatimonadota bacterium]
MTSRERVLAAIDHRQPDRVPVDLSAMRSTGIMAIAYNRLKKHLGWEVGATRVYDVVQQLAQPDDAALDFWQADAVDLGRAFLTQDTDWKPFTLPDGSAATIPAWVEFEPSSGGWLYRAEDGTVIGSMPAGVHYMSQCCWPMLDWETPFDLDRVPEAMKKVTWAALPTAPYHVPWTAETMPEIRRRAQEFYASTDKAVMLAFGANFLEWGQFLRRIDNFLLDLVAEPQRTHALLDKLLEVHLASVDRVLGLVGDCIDVLQLGDDYGTQAASQISPKTYREFIKPRLATVVERVRTRSNCRLFLHSCGAIAELIPDIIETGIEIINPVQTSCAAMEPERLKQEFGADLCFWGGGCDTRTVLPHGTPAEIRDHVRERMNTFGPGGGFVFAQVHNILSTVPPENVVAMVEAAKEFRTLS